MSGGFNPMMAAMGGGPGGFPGGGMGGPPGGFPGGGMYGPPAGMF
jgi:suppressor of tumorigenicity protein 13